MSGGPRTVRAEPLYSAVKVAQNNGVFDILVCLLDQMFCLKIQYFQKWIFLEFFLFLTPNWGCRKKGLF